MQSYCSSTPQTIFFLNRTIYTGTLVYYPMFFKKHSKPSGLKKTMSSSWYWAGLAGRLFCSGKEIWRPGHSVLSHVSHSLAEIVRTGFTLLIWQLGPFHNIEIKSSQSFCIIDDFQERKLPVILRARSGTASVTFDTLHWSKISYKASSN